MKRQTWSGAVISCGTRGEGADKSVRSRGNRNTHDSTMQHSIVSTPSFVNVQNTVQGVRFQPPALLRKCVVLVSVIIHE